MPSRTPLPLCAALVAVAAVPGLAAPDHDRPFKGSLTSTVTAGPIPTEFGAYFEGTVAGQATVIGKFTGTFAYYLNPSTGEFAGVITKVAANGDEIHETFSGQYNAGFTGSTGQTVFTGGTGRFAGVTGGTSFTGTVTSDTTAVLDFTGTISQGK
jgi:hypothetical protein